VSQPPSHWQLSPWHSPRLPPLQARSALREDHRVRGGQIGGEFRGGHNDDGITPITIRKLKASSD